MLKRRHAQWDARFLELGLVKRTNLFGLIFVLEQVTAFVLAEIWPPWIADQPKTAA